MNISGTPDASAANSRVKVKSCMWPRWMPSKMPMVIATRLPLSAPEVAPCPVDSSFAFHGVIRGSASRAATLPTPPAAFQAYTGCLQCRLSVPFSTQTCGRLSFWLNAVSAAVSSVLNSCGGSNSWLSRTVSTMPAIIRYSSSICFSFPVPQDRIA